MLFAVRFFVANDLNKYDYIFCAIFFKKTLY
jgi:hypothetical protein